MGNITYWSRTLFFTSLVIVACAFAQGAQAAVFTPETADELMDALATAASNGEDDTITLGAGTFSTTTPFKYESDGETNSLTITGAGNGTTVITNTSEDGNGMEITAGGSVTISGIAFEDSPGTGLHIDADSAGGDLNIEISGNEFTGNERGLAIDNGHLGGAAILEGNEFSENVFAGSGAGLYINSSVTGVAFPVTLSGNTFEGNVATSTSHGGGGYITIATASSTLSLFDNEFTNNEADVQGAGIYLITSGADSDIVIGDSNDGNTFDGNRAGDSGGGFYVKTSGDDSSVDIIENEFTSNTSDAQGGGFHADIDADGDSVLTITDNTIGVDGAGNSSEESGGGAHMYVLRGLVFENNTVSDNTAADGGGIAVRIDGDAVNDQPNYIHNNTFTGNTAANDVGGLDVHVSSVGGVTIDANLFVENESGDEGGGARLLFNNAGDEAVVTNNIFYGNTAGGRSGGFDFYGQANTDFDFIHNTLLGNTAANAGGAGFRLSDDAATFNLFDNIFWDNALSTDGVGTDVLMDLINWSAVNFAYNAVGGNENDLCVWDGDYVCPPTDGVATGYSQQHLSHEDPEFATSPAYELTAGSPLLNIGFSALTNYPDFDYEGNARIYGDAPDLGALELQQAADPEETDEDESHSSSVSSSRSRGAAREPEDTLAQLRARLEALIAQLLALGGTLPSGSSASSQSGTVRDLTLEDSGEDVRALQTLLINQSYSIPAGATGYFGLQTQYALDAYQVANGIAPRGGYFGPITRAQMKAAGLSGLWW